MSTGWMALFPIHAAGDHRRALETGEPCSVLDLTTSSHCNSLRSLKYVREMHGSSYGKSVPPTSALLVKMPTTPDQRPLTWAAQEVSRIEKVLNLCGVRTTVPNNPIRDDVLERLRQSDIFHCACHGIADTEDPSLSKVLLRDWKIRPLDVRAILRLEDLRCKLVYLSAYESAVGKNIKLREEGIHLSSGFQMAGVPHVVGTMWEIADEFSAQVAEEFYSGLKEGNTLDIGRSAETLRNVVLDARLRGVDPLLWAAYIHSGP